MRVSNSQRSLFLQCGKKYKYRYIHKLRPKEKGNALFFGSAFDAASDILINEKDLPKAKERFSELWMAHEQNLYCKFSKTDLELRLYEPPDIAKHGNVIDLIKDIKKMKDQSFTRDLTLEEERFLHYATVLSMLRKGYLMLESFQRNISPHITGVIGTQVQINAENGLGDSIIGYIDLLCNMSGYKLPNGRILTADDLVVADVKTAGVTYWAKLDDLNNSDQLDSYLIAPAVQSIQATNLIAYFAVAKQVSKDEQSFCKSCANEKKSSHKTCNAEIDGKRCNGEWKEQVTYFCEAKMVVGERNVQDASQMYDDYNQVVAGVKAGIFIRNREACNAYGGVCEYAAICSKYLTPEQEDIELQEWKDKFGE
jgi:hypothetical protein